MAESKGTYEHIKEYILSKYGFKVSTLYIAQIKKKHGLELRDNYNKSKKENSKVPECSKEKEDADFFSFWCGRIIAIYSDLLWRCCIW